MNPLVVIRAMWMAYPAAPEVDALRRLRIDFLAATGLLFGLMLLPNGIWHACPALILLVAPLGLAALLTGTRYFVSKAAADERYRQDLIAGFGNDAHPERADGAAPL